MAKDKAGLAFILGGLGKKGSGAGGGAPEPEGDEPVEGMDGGRSQAAQDMLSAIAADDPGAFADALDAYLDIRGA
jgi:hypothetical protein